MSENGCEQVGMDENARQWLGISENTLEWQEMAGMAANE